MAEQVGWRSLIEHLKDEAPRFSQIFPQLPRLAHAVLQHRAYSDLDMGDLMAQMVQYQRRTNRLLILIACVGGVAAALGVFALGLHFGGGLHGL
jgi:ubiquinone biosynthesis protein